MGGSDSKEEKTDAVNKDSGNSNANVIITHIDNQISQEKDDLAIIKLLLFVLVTLFIIHMIIQIWLNKKLNMKKKYRAQGSVMNLNSVRATTA